MHSSTVLCLGACATVLSGCIEPPQPVATRSVTERNVRVTVLDAEGVVCAPDAMPRRPRLLLNIPELASSGPGVMLFAGAPDTGLVHDLERLPLTAASSSRLIAADVRRADDNLSIEPRATLPRAATITLAIPRTAIPTKLRDHWPAVATRTLRIADTPDAGAAVSGTFPADGTASVSPDLDYAVITFDGHVAGVEAGIWLQTQDGLAVPASVERVSCDEFDTHADDCVRVTPHGRLQPESEYSLHTGRALTDAHGAEVPATTAAFTTRSTSVSSELTWQTVGCGLDETPTPVGCALLEDERITLRVAPSVSTRLRIVLARDREALLSGPRPVETRFEGLEPDTPYAVDVHAEPIDGAALDTTFTLTTSAPLPALCITEVLADPRGPEPDQEFVEVMNFGAQALALRGYTLSDRVDELGTVLDTDLVLPGGALALLVPDAFDPESTRDVPPAAGAVLVRVGKSVTRSGLANSGEPLFLRDPLLRRVSAAPAVPAPQSGVCSVRSSQDPRSGAPGTFAFAVDGTCTPGR